MTATINDVMSRLGADGGVGESVVARGCPACGVRAEADGPGVVTMIDGLFRTGHEGRCKAQIIAFKDAGNSLRHRSPVVGGAPARALDVADLDRPYLVEVDEEQDDRAPGWWEANVVSNGGYEDDDGRTWAAEYATFRHPERETAKAMAHEWAQRQVWQERGR